LILEIIDEMPDIVDIDTINLRPIPIPILRFQTLVRMLGSYKTCPQNE